MKRYIVSSIFTIVVLGSGLLSAIPAKKALVGVGTSPVENLVTFDKNGVHTDSETQFGGAYIWGDIIQGNDYVTAGGKIYYRINAVKDFEDESQKLEIKRAYIKVRPAGNDFFEIGLGKVYSYFLPGSYFSLAEVYTGNNRWGKTGLGTKFEFAGFTTGLAVPATESYVPFKDDFTLAAAIDYNFAHLNESVPIDLGFAASQDFIKEEFKFAVSTLFAPKTTGFISKTKLFLSYSYKAEPYVANSTFKNVANYNLADLKKAHLGSLNFNMNFGKVALTQEAEAGHSIDGDYIPVYSGTELFIPITEHIGLKPRVFYYAAFNTEDSDLSRQSVEFYPRLWLTFGKCDVSAGAIITLMQAGTSAKDAKLSDWYTGWEIPLYATYKF